MMYNLLGIQTTGWNLMKVAEDGKRWGAFGHTWIASPNL